MYTRLFLPDSIIKEGGLDQAIIAEQKKPCVIHLDGESTQDSPAFRSMPSLDDMLSLLQTKSVRDINHRLFLSFSCFYCY